jgi:hypothetical protein
MKKYCFLQVKPILSIFHMWKLKIAEFKPENHVESVNVFCSLVIRLLSASLGPIDQLDVRLGVLKFGVSRSPLRKVSWTFRFEP